ncbi:uncharacterized protein LOC119721157 [Patiria miniata]|uniref:Uncharacterized protein n=1 Tax=Patiria miniata TaxID=46514 RepID=A0A913Z7X3_PATMI|nr:uncharacterized protein LOC119721157 [Patiria miniata]
MKFWTPERPGLQDKTVPDRRTRASSSQDLHPTRRGRLNHGGTWQSLCRYGTPYQRKHHNKSSTLICWWRAMTVLGSRWTSLSIQWCLAYSAKTYYSWYVTKCKVAYQRQPSAADYEYVTEQNGDAKVDVTVSAIFVKY